MGRIRTHTATEEFAAYDAMPDVLREFFRLAHLSFSAAGLLEQVVRLRSQGRALSVEQVLHALKDEAADEVQEFGKAYAARYGVPYGGLEAPATPMFARRQVRERRQWRRA